MSTYWRYHCMDHNPPLVAEMEFTQHTDDRHFQRGIDLVAQRPVELDNSYWERDYTDNDEQGDKYFTMQARAFLHYHPTCRLELVSENGEHRDSDGTNPRWEQP